MKSEPPSLYALALQQCIKYSNFIDDIGDTPYILVKPILAKLPHEQLAEIEQRAPHIVDQSDELWREVIAREFRDRKIPSRNYRQTFYKYCNEKEEQLVAARERLKAKQEQFSQHKRATSVIALSETDLPMNQRGMPQPSFKSRPMQSVARRTQASAQMRRPGSAGLPQFTSGLHGSRMRTPLHRSTRSGASTPSISPPSSSPPSVSPPSTPTSSSVLSTTQAPRSAPSRISSMAASPALRPPPMKRRKVPSVFMQRK